MYVFVCICRKQFWKYQHNDNTTTAITFEGGDGLEGTGQIEETNGKETFLSIF